MITTISLIINVAAIAVLALKLRKKTPQVKQAVVREQPKGFLDFRTGRREDVNPKTGKEEFVN